MDVVHAVEHDPAHLLETLIAPHRRHRVPLHEHIAVRKQLDSLERAPSRTDDALAALHETLLVAHNARDLDHVASHAVLKHLERLRGGHTTREELEQVARLEDDIGVPGLAGGAHGHLALDEVELARKAVAVERGGDTAPYGAQVGLAVLGEEEGEGRLLEEGLVRALGRRRHRLDLPTNS